MNMTNDINLFILFRLTKELVDKVKGYGGRFLKMDGDDTVSS